MKNNSIIEEFEKKYPVNVISIDELIELLEERYSKKEKNCSVKSQSTKFMNLSDDVVKPNAEYIEHLLESLTKIKGILGDWEYSNYEQGLIKILREGDFGDPEEIMTNIHGLIKKFIYGSDIKVSASDWKLLERYMENAGYTPISVKCGDDISKFKIYFDRPIQAIGGTPNTIKQIQLIPYIIEYYDGEQIITEKLCGKCTYYI